ncbi:hypothetical protein ABMA27_010599 [Loxostege sticticalis]|uniref:Integrase catalytic domain-containing protein n=1 Tax=Loxostege sticticalis TaxID=481309 RepID=A0ABR3H3M6_LOXSC
MDAAEEQTSRPIGRQPEAGKAPSQYSGGHRTLTKPSSRKSRKETLLSQARRKLELAAARVAEIEAANRVAELEEQEDTDGEDTVTTNQETERRVNDWLDASQSQLLAITDQPHNRPPATQQNEAVEAREIAEQQAAPTTAHAIPMPHVMNNSTPAPAGVEGTVAVQQPQQINLSELASAIALAARAGQQLVPRYNTELPIFSGSHQEWLSFKAAYMESASAYTETENTARLRRSLRGRAKEVVENLLIYNPKPEEVLKSLESRFGRPDAIALAELERLRALQRPTDAPKDLCIFATKVTNIVTTLRALDKIYYLYNPEVTKATIEKLTPAMRYRWFDFAAENQQEEADLLKLARFLQREADRCGPYAQPEQITGSSGGAQIQRRTTLRTYNTEMSTEQQECPVCKKQGHTTTTCKKFKEADVSTRWDIAKKKYLCFRCLKQRTRNHSCRGKQCAIDDCHRLHHNLLHLKKEKPIVETEERVEIVSSTWTPTKTQAYLKIVPVRVSGPKGQVDTHALLDDGSTVTLLDADIAKQTGVKGPVEPLHIEAIANTEVEAGASRRVTLTLHGDSGSYNIQARTFKNLQLSSQTISDEDLVDCRHLSDIEHKLKYNKVIPKLLIGQDNWHLLLARKVRRGNSRQPVASLTPLGWVLHGAHTRTLGQQVNHIYHLTEIEEKMDEELRHHFALESLLITPKRPTTDPEKRALDLLKEHTKQREDGRYETTLLWKSEEIEMANNFENACNRLLSTEKKIDKDLKLREKYNEQMNALINKGYAEQAPPSSSEKKTWYLPHFPVLNPMKPGKVRVVHDAAAKTKGMSLNDCLLTGPDLLQSLPGVLMRFRQHPIAVTADIAEMFMQVKIREEDRDALRYLWRGENREQQPTEYRMTSLIFGATSSPATAIYVKNINAEKYKLTHPAAYEAIVKNHYVDDYLQSFKNLEEAKKISQKVRDIQKEAHYDLKKWTSNCTELIAMLDENNESQPSKDLDDGTKTERVLGLIWKPGTDELAFNLNLARLPPEVMDDKEPTKRKILKIIMSLFDPLGFASPVTTRAKQILQETWRRGTGWDDKLDEDLIHQWQQWMEHLRALKDIGIPRCHLHYSDATRRELHIFVDASEAAYAAVIYWRLTNPDGEVSLSFVLGKARVAPLKITSIPRLELQAAVMGSRMAAAVMEEHDEKPDQRIFWTDSRTVLTWLKTGARSYKPYVAHRIAAIEENSKVTEWRWIPTKLNVADDATRDVPNHLDTTHRWFSGPDFLKNDSSTWPSDRLEIDMQTGEEKTHHIGEKNPVSIKNAVPDPSRFSKWERLLRTTARVVQFITLCKRKTAAVNYKRTLKNKEKDPAWNARKARQQTRTPRATIEERKNFLPIEPEILKKAEELLIRTIQMDSFAEEIKSMNNGKAIPKDSRLRSLAVENINGVLTLKTRIAAAMDVVIEKRPPILDGNHRITRLFMDFIHRQLHHSGVESTINECRQRFWILRMRPTARAIIKNCLPCRIRRNTPPTPATGNHPPCRLAHHHRPFTFTGVDYFGPLTTTVGRSTQKVYVALFTCLTTRAVHLEMAASLSTDSAVMALRRMAARRGCPTEMWSDNGTNLQGAAKELTQATEEEAKKKGISWRFIPPGAPFMGGAWERLVKSVKTALTTVLHERSPTQEVLMTLLAEAEYTVNSRPLTHVSVSPEDPEALTPNHFLLGGSALSPTFGTFDESDLIGRTHWRASQRLADLFWARWLKEYLPDLQYRREPYGRGPAIKVGDVVLITDGTLPRNVWPRGLVTAVFPGPDGVIRAVDVRTKGGILRRPAKKLVILPTEPADLHQDLDASS